MGISVNEAGRKGGLAKSAEKKKAAEKNGKKGGRPPENPVSKKK